MPLHARDLQFEVRRAFLPFGLTPLQAIGTVLAITAFATWRILRRTRRAPRPDWETAPPVAPPEAAPAPPAQAPPVAVPPVAVADPIDGPPPAI